MYSKEDTFRVKGKWMMYKGLWKLITKYADNGHAVSIFLPVLIVLWTLAGIAAGLIVCSAYRCRYDDRACGPDLCRRICGSDTGAVWRMLLSLSAWSVKKD